MANYVKATNFTAKDSLPTGNSGKIVKGAEIDTEFTAIASAISSKADTNSPTFTGTPTAPTASVGTNTTQIASTAYVKAEITALSLGNMAIQAKTAVDITGGTINSTEIGGTTAAAGKFSTLEATGVTTVQAGTAALPAITTTGDTNTGIFFSAADTIDFAEGGAATGQFDSSGNFKFNSGYGSVATAYGCRAWVNFDGTGTPAIRASGNVSSITDNGTGDYTVNFTNAMPDVNYAVVGSSAVTTGGGGYRWLAVGSGQASDFSMTTTSIRVQTVYDATNRTDAEFAAVAIFR
jgi:hypothetical protein